MYPRFLFASIKLANLRHPENTEHGPEARILHHFSTRINVSETKNFEELLEPLSQESIPLNLQVPE